MTTKSTTALAFQDGSAACGARVGSGRSGSMRRRNSRRCYLNQVAVPSVVDARASCYVAAVPRFQQVLDGRGREASAGRGSTAMGLVRLLQISDFHLGRPFGWLPPDRREIRRRDQREALERAAQGAIERNVHRIVV